MNKISISKKLNLLGNTLTIVSYIFLVLFILSFIFSSVPTMIDGIDKQLFQNEISEKAGGIFGVIIGSLIALIIIIIIPLQFAGIHKKFKKYVENENYKQKFIFSYVFCWIIIFITFLISFLSKNVGIIITIFLFLLLPTIYLTSIHKYTKKDGNTEV
ncbi:hypothetical protein [Epilithonimonas hispanica]|nr:hypothetical protein [Epilithonimonas hispanica]